jgi:hypothetical protein
MAADAENNIATSLNGRVSSEARPFYLILEQDSSHLSSKCPMRRHLRADQDIMVGSFLVFGKIGREADRNHGKDRGNLGSSKGGAIASLFL